MKRIGSIGLVCLIACVALAVSPYIVMFERGTLLGIDQDGWGGFVEGLALGALIVLFRRRRSTLDR